MRFRLWLSEATCSHGTAYPVRGPGGPYESFASGKDIPMPSIASRSGSFAPARTGSLRPTRPAQLDPAVAENLAGGTDPQAIDNIAHTTAESLLDRVRHTQDPQVVQRVLTLVEHEGVDLVAELWSKSDVESLPGILWRLYMMRTWMVRNREAIARFWRNGEPVAGAASAIAGIDPAPEAADIVRTADSILRGAFTGDFAVALERAGVFCGVVSLGMRIESKALRERLVAVQQSSVSGTGRIAEADIERAAQRMNALAKQGGSLADTAKAFAKGAKLWRAGKLE